MSKTIKIARISGEFLNEQGEVFSYLQPYTGYDFNQWFLIKKAKKIFDSLNFDSITKEEDDILEKSTKEEMEIEILINSNKGFKPRVYLFTVEIPNNVWKNKKKLAEKFGYEDDLNGYITDYTNYEWELECDREIEIPKHLNEMFEEFIWIQDNKIKLQEKYMQYLVETGGDENITEEAFYLFTAREGRDIIDF